jgi:hypothetical protein
MAITTPSYHVRSKEDCRLQAVMAIFRGEQASHVSVTFRISRSDLYKLRNRALTAMRQALADHRWGPKRPHNRLDPAQEGGVVAFCQRHPTLSSYQVRQQLGIHTPSPRTIQRVRKRHGLARLPKRLPATRPARRLTPEAIQRAAAVISEKPYLGPQRIAWDLHNGEHLTISPATIKRLKRQLHEAMCPPPPLPCGASMNDTTRTASGTGTSWRRSPSPIWIGRPINSR